MKKTRLLTKFLGLNFLFLSSNWAFSADSATFMQGPLIISNESQSSDSIVLESALPGNGIKFANDTFLYRFKPGILRIASSVAQPNGGHLIVDGALVARRISPNHDQIEITTTDIGGGIVWASETFLYRSGIGELMVTQDKAPANFVVTGNLTAGGTFGVNGKSPQEAFPLGPPADDFESAVKLLNNIREALIANGIGKEK